MLGVFGAILPLTTGSRAWVTSPIPSIQYGLYLPVILILSVGAGSFAGERERHTLETLLAVLTALLIVWAMALFRRSKLILSGS